VYVYIEFLYVFLLFDNKKIEKNFIWKLPYLFMINLVIQEFPSNFTFYYNEL
jgi:hypothetical protein